MLAAGCEGRVIEHRPDGAAHVAVGAAVRVVMDRPCTTGDEHEAELCLSETPTGLHDIEFSGELISHGVHSHELVAEVRTHELGDHVLSVTYPTPIPSRFRRDDEIHRDHFTVRAHEVERIEAEVDCENYAPDRTVYPVAVGSAFTLTAKAFAGGQPIALGDMNPVANAGAFEARGMVRPGEWELIAPHEPGEYEITLVGASSFPFNVLVYEPSDAGVALTYQRPFPRDALPHVLITAGYDGQATCTNVEGGSIVSVERSGGDCRLVADGFALDGPILVDLADGSAEIAVLGEGECTIEGRTETSSDRLQMELEPREPPEPKLEDSALSATARDVAPPLPSYAGCSYPSSLEADNGLCTVLWDGWPFDDMDCDVTWSWHTQRDDDEPIGVGLRGLLHASVEYSVDGQFAGTYAPRALDVSSPADIETDFAGCSSDDVAAILVRPQEAGTHALELEANNTDTDGTFVIETRPIATIDYALPDYAFPDWDTQMEIRFLAGDGAELSGATPVLALTDVPQAGAAIDFPEVYTGTEPNTITLRTSALSDPHELHVVGVDAIHEVAGVVEHEFNLGDVMCMTNEALSETGALIPGHAPEPPVLRIDGASAIWSPRGIDGESRPRICLVGITPGDTHLSVEWGSATAETTWTVR